MSVNSLYTISLTHSRQVIKKTIIIAALCVCVLAPKVSLTLLASFGIGYNNIVLCTGHGYVTVTTDSSGNIISDVSEKWEHDHCSPVSSPYTRLNRDWNNAQYPFYFKHLQVAHSREHLADTDTLPNLYARAPPLS